VEPRLISHRDHDNREELAQPTEIRGISDELREYLVDVTIC